MKCCTGVSLMDMCLNCVLYCYDKINSIFYECYKLFYWVWYLFIIAIIIILVMMAYYILDQLLTPEFIEGMGAYQLLTIGLGAQRSVRNQVIATTALGYNEYTLVNMEDNMRLFAQERNDDAFQQNEKEFESVSQYNFVLSQNWKTFHDVARDVSSQGQQGGWVNLNEYAANSSVYVFATTVDNGTYFTYETSIANNPMDGAGIDKILDSSTSTYWTPYPSTGTAAAVGQDVIIDFYLSPIRMTDEVYTGWDIEQITLDWRFELDSSNTPLNETTPITFEIYYESNVSDTWIQFDYGATGNSFEPAVTRGIRQTDSSFSMNINIEQEISTKRLQLRLLDVNNWGTEYFLNDVRFDGHAPQSEVVVPVVQFQTWLFDGSLTRNENATTYIEDNVYYDNQGTYVEQCPEPTPIHGLMYRGFSRRVLNEQLAVGHEPFIMALRNIALSPFYIAIFLLGILFMAYLFTFIMEWFLMKLDLYRENPYAKVPLVTSLEDYDVNEHEVGPEQLGVSTAWQTSGQNKSYKAPLLDHDGPGVTKDKTAIEMNMMNNVNNTLRGKGKALGSSSDVGTHQPGHRAG